MSILVDKDIKAEIDNDEIVINPYRPECVGSNSVDVHLAPTLMVVDHCVTYEVDQKTFNKRYPKS